MSRYSDHFSGLAADYRRFRPAYPPALFEYLAKLAPGRETAWDCGTGSGQAATGLARHFKRVVGTDASLQQVSRAPPGPGVYYLCCLAEAPALAENCADLVSIAQALHWFKPDPFFQAVKRVLRPQGVIAAWTYQLFTISPAIDEIIRRLHDVVLEADWPPERRHVDNGYRELSFPFQEVKAPQFAMHARWEQSQVLGYLNTWSGVDRYRKRTGKDPLESVARDIQLEWPTGSGRLEVRWPLSLRVGRCLG